MADQLAAYPTLVRSTFAAAAAWAPDAKRPPFFLDLPTVNGVAQKDVLAKYAANAPTVMATKYAGALKRYSAIAMDVGTQDTLLGGNAALDKVLTSNGIKHTYTTYEGDHVNRVPQRYGLKRHASGNTVEADRARSALELAASGVITGGDRRNRGGDDARNDRRDHRSI